MIIIGNLIPPSDLPKLRESFGHFSTQISTLALYLPISVLNFPLLLHILGLNFPLPTLASNNPRTLHHHKVQNICTELTGVVPAAL